MSADPQACTCPSGDGSLRWPCPVHPAPLTITSSLCQRCGACCSAMVEGELVACQHLDTKGGFRCRIYPVRPQVCREYSCVRDGRIVSSAVAPRVQAAIELEAIHA